MFCTAYNVSRFFTNYHKHKDVNINILMLRVHCTLYIVHYILYSVYCTVHYTVYIIWCIVHCKIHITPYIIYCTLYNIQCTLHHTVYTVHYTLYTIHCTMYTIQYCIVSRDTLHSLHTEYSGEIYLPLEN